MQTSTLAPGYAISRVIRGGWQLAGGHGQITRDSALRDLCASADAGITTFDGADIYTGVEELFGEFRRLYANTHGQAAANNVRLHTKCVPDRDTLPNLSPASLTSLIERSIQRLGSELDLVQFHWWDFSIPGYLEALHHLTRLRQKGLIRHLAVTNFDCEHLQTAIAAGMPLVSNQVQFSVLDQRPRHGMIDLCQRYGTKLLCYGTLAGGFISERYLDAPPPTPPLENRSLTKYQLIMEDTGGWERFQAVLQTLQHIGHRHGASIGQIASAYVLAQPTVAAVIVGSRNANHLAATCRLDQIALSPADHHDIDSCLQTLQSLPGDIYGLERANSRHANVMRYNLNRDQ